MVKRFDPEQLRDAASDLRKLVDKLDEELDGFLNDTKGKGEPAGDAEPIGMLLGESYAAAEEVLIEGIESVTTGIETFAEKLEVVAGSHEGAEGQNKSDAERTMEV